MDELMLIKMYKVEYVGTNSQVYEEVRVMASLEVNDNESWANSGIWYGREEEERMRSLVERAKKLEVLSTMYIFTVRRILGLGSRACPRFTSSVREEEAASPKAFLNFIQQGAPKVQAMVLRCLGDNALLREAEEMEEWAALLVNNSQAVANNARRQRCFSNTNFDFDKCATWIDEGLASSSSRSPPQRGGLWAIPDKVLGMDGVGFSPADNEDGGGRTELGLEAQIPLRHFFQVVKDIWVFQVLDKKIMERVSRKHPQDFPVEICRSFWREVCILLSQNEEGAEEKAQSFKSDSWKSLGYPKINEGTPEYEHRMEIFKDGSAGLKLIKLQRFVSEDYEPKWGLSFFKFCEFYWQMKSTFHPPIKEIIGDISSRAESGEFVFEGHNLRPIVDIFASIWNGTFILQSLNMPPGQP